MTEQETDRTSHEELEDWDDLHGFLESETELSATELLQEARGKNVVHETKLRNLVESWRSGTFADHEAGKAFEQAMNSCADDLEELIEDGQ